jgi:hypothetical protein
VAWKEETEEEEAKKKPGRQKGKTLPTFQKFPSLLFSLPLSLVLAPVDEGPFKKGEG